MLPRAMGGLARGLVRLATVVPHAPFHWGGGLGHAAIFLVGLIMVPMSCYRVGSSGALVPYRKDPSRVSW